MEAWVVDLNQQVVDINHVIKSGAFPVCNAVCCVKF